MKKNQKIIFLVFSLGLIFIPPLQTLAGTDQDETEPSLYIAVATENGTASSTISDRAGRAPYFLIFDSKGVFTKALENPAQNQRGGASLSVTALLKRESVDTFIAAKMGVKMENNLKASGIKHYTYSGIAKEVVAIVVNNERNHGADD